MPTRCTVRSMSWGFWRCRSAWPRRTRSSATFGLVHEIAHAPAHFALVRRGQPVGQLPELADAGGAPRAGRGTSRGGWTPRSRPRWSRRRLMSDTRPGVCQRCGEPSDIPRCTTCEAVLEAERHRYRAQDGGARRRSGSARGIPGQAAGNRADLPREDPRRSGAQRGAPGEGERAPGEDDVGPGEAGEIPRLPQDLERQEPGKGQRRATGGVPQGQATGDGQ